MIVWNGNLDTVAGYYRDMPTIGLPRKHLRFYGVCMGNVAIGVVISVKGKSSPRVRV